MSKHRDGDDNDDAADGVAPAQREMTFWEHLEDLRWVLLRSTIVVAACTVLMFFNKERLTQIIFAPQSSDFIVYRAMCSLAAAVHFADLCPDEFSVELLNTRLASPFFTHMTSSLYAGLLLSLPVVIIMLWRFIAPALYPRERRRGIPLILSCIVLFMSGVLLGYFLVFPLAFRFLGLYQFGANVINRIDLGSYMNIFYTTLLSMGLVFEMPMLAYTLSRIGIISKEMLRKYRRHAVVVILVVGAVITPTSDPFTLMLVSVPMYLLYELSISVTKRKAAEA
ncbi:MAG: twin-arginine translocase subunit TatC [Prevotellaceae bacterium]|jgi:sec-independent protein translocase protein TatC|nr:twin-arginine translocase subunit TatC [Prevotellaceae bacterium]